jgi:hypothetical protein
MAGAQREANGPRRAGPGAASAKWRWPLGAFVLCWGLAATVSGGRADELREQVDRALRRGLAGGRSGTSVGPQEERLPWPPAPAGPAPDTRLEAVRLPEHVRSDTGKLAGTSGLHGDSRIDEAPLGPLPEERTVVPVPTQLLEKVGVRLLRRVRIRVMHGLGHLAKVARSREVGPGVDAQMAAANAIGPPASLSRGLLTAPPAPADTAPALASAPTAATRPPIGPVALATAPPTEAPSTKPPPAAAAPPEVITVDADVLGRIRIEIKSRLPYFQACADAARRRGAPDVRRIRATWVIANDGSIKELRLEGALDARLATCVARMGKLPFPVSPGTELTIPTPIVFVR